MLLGKTGAGKRSAGNTIMGEDTKHCEVNTKMIIKKIVIVTDTPGICDMDCAPGPHAFVLVLRVGRFTEDKSVVKNIRSWFGDA
ncbi:unnamed protein product, partial [Coregonus sp. 'balchen']